MIGWYETASCEIHDAYMMYVAVESSQLDRTYKVDHISGTQDEDKRSQNDTEQSMDENEVNKRVEVSVM